MVMAVMKWLMLWLVYKAAFVTAAHKYSYQAFEGCTSSNRMYPDQEDCRKFIRCVDGKPVTWSCPPNLAFDPQTQVCSWIIGNSGCDGEPEVPIGGPFSHLLSSVAQKSSPFMADLAMKKISSLRDRFLTNKKSKRDGNKIEPEIPNRETVTEKLNTDEKVILKALSTEPTKQNTENDISLQETTNTENDQSSQTSGESFDKTASPTKVSMIEFSLVKSTNGTNKPEVVQNLTMASVPEDETADIITKHGDMKDSRATDDKDFTTPEMIKPNPTGSFLINKNKKNKKQELLNKRDGTNRQEKITMNLNMSEIKGKDEEHSTFSTGSDEMKNSTRNINMTNLFKVGNEEDEIKPSTIVNDNKDNDDNSKTDDTLNDANTRDIHLNFVNILKTGAYDTQTKTDKIDATGRDTVKSENFQMTPSPTMNDRDTTTEMPPLPHTIPTPKDPTTKTTTESATTKMSSSRVSFKALHNDIPSPTASTKSEVVSPQLKKFNLGSKGNNQRVAINTYSGNILSDMTDYERQPNPKVAMRSQRIPKSRESENFRKIDDYTYVDILNENLSPIQFLDLFQDSFPEMPSSTPATKLWYTRHAESFNNPWYLRDTKEKLLQEQKLSMNVGGDNPSDSPFTFGETWHGATPPNLAVENKVNEMAYAAPSESTTQSPESMSSTTKVGTSSISTETDGARLKASPYMARGIGRRFRCPKPTGHFPDPTNCGVFYHCDRGVGYRRDCPPGQVFHETVLSCVSSSLLPPCLRYEELQLVEDIGFECPSSYGVFKDPDSCTHYFECTSGTPIKRKCMTGTLFDADRSKCSWSKVVPGCETASEHNEVVEPTAQDIFECPRDGYFRDPSSCSVYYLCNGGEVIKKACETGTSFDVSLNMCVWNNMVQGCEHLDRDVTAHPYSSGQNNNGEDGMSFESSENLQENTVVSEWETEQSDFTCPEPDGTFVDTRNCKVYYICKDYSAKLMRCPYGSGFDVTTGFCLGMTFIPRCVEQAHATRGKNKQEEFALENSMTSFQCLHDHGLYPDASNCSVFIHCFEGKAYRHACQDGTLYSHSTAACTWPHLVPECRDGKHVNTKTDTSDSNNGGDDELNSVAKTRKRGRRRHRYQFEGSNSFHNADYYGSENGKDDDYNNNNNNNYVNNNDKDNSYNNNKNYVNNNNNNYVNNDNKDNNRGSQRRRSRQRDSGKGGYNVLTFSNNINDNNNRGLSVQIQDFNCPALVDGYYRDPYFCDIFHRCSMGTKFTFFCPSGTFFRIELNICDFWDTVTDCSREGLRLGAFDALPQTLRSSNSFPQNSRDFNTPETRPFTQGTDPFPSVTDRYSSQTGPFPSETNQYSPQTLPSETDQFSSQTGPFLSETDQYNSQTGPFQSETDQFSSQTGPFQSETDRYSSQTGPFQSETDQYSSQTGPFQSETDQYSSQTGPFQSETDRYSSQTGPFQSETDQYSSQTGPFQSETDRYSSQTGPFQSETDQFSSQTAPFQSETDQFSSQTGPFQSETDQYSSESRPYSSQNVPLSNHSPEPSVSPLSGQGEQREELFPYETASNQDIVPCPASSGLFAHPNNCQQFIFCAQSVPLVLTCPDSLLYNPRTLTCDFPANVRCLRYDSLQR